MEWKTEWFRFKQRGWIRNNQRKILESIAKQLNIKKPSEWGTVTTDTFCKVPEGSKILQLHGSSIRKALKSIYPGFKNILH